MNKTIVPLLLLLVILQVFTAQAFLPAVSMVGRSSLLFESNVDESTADEATHGPADQLGIHFTQNAMNRLFEIRELKEKNLRTKTGQNPGIINLFVRFGVKKGGCKGMSYTMEFIEKADIKPDDIFSGLQVGHDMITIVSTKADILYLYGLELDYSDKLVGGGFKFDNPNAKKSCSCGTSFGV